MVDGLQGEVGETEDDVGAPEGEGGQWVAFRTDHQVVEATEGGQGAELLQLRDVGRLEDESLRGGTNSQVNYQRGQLSERSTIREVNYQRGQLSERSTIREVNYQRG